MERKISIFASKNNLFIPDVSQIRIQQEQLHELFEKDDSKLKRIILDATAKENEGKLIGFYESWNNKIAFQFQYLRCFAGMLATPYPTTATVESDFSQMKLEKNDYRLSLHDLSLEGIMHCKSALHLTDKKNEKNVLL